MDNSVAQHVRSTLGRANVRSPDWLRMLRPCSMRARRLVLCAGRAGPATATRRRSVLLGGLLWSVLVSLAGLVAAPSIAAPSIAAPSIAAAAPVAAPSAAPTDPVARGTAIAADAARRLAGFRDYQVSVRMLLVHPGSGQELREMRVRNIEMPEQGERSLVDFDSPLDQRGTALLTHSKAGQEDEQWLFLPALNRVKRIAGRNRSGPFVGSEFAFEDLTEQQLARYRYRYLDSQRLADGVLCDRVERVPLDANSGYSRQIAWYDVEARRLRRIDFFDRRDNPVKTFTASEFRLYAARWWRPLRMRMQSVNSGKYTELVWGEFRFGTGLSADRDFNVATLQRSR